MHSFCSSTYCTIVLTVVWNDSRKRALENERKKWRLTNEGKSDVDMPDDIRLSRRGMASAATFERNTGQHERDKKMSTKNEGTLLYSLTPPQFTQHSVVFYSDMQLIHHRGPIHLHTTKLTLKSPIRYMAIRFIPKCIVNR